MKFGLLYELQLPRPWDNRAEHRMMIPVVAAYGRTVVAAKDVTDKPTYRIGAAGGFEIPMEDPAAKKTAAE
jgi:hypothetical protein